MNISLAAELEEFVSNKVKTGQYQTASEVVREGLLLLRERDDLHQQQLEELRKQIGIGIEEADQGKVAPFNAQETLARVRQQREARTLK